MTRELFLISITQTGTAYITPLTTSIYHPTSRAISTMIGSNGKTSSLVPRLIIFHSRPSNGVALLHGLTVKSGVFSQRKTRVGKRRNFPHLLISGKNSVIFDVRSRHIVRTKRREYFQKLPSLLKSNSKKLWSVFKSTSKHSNIPSKMSWTQQDSTFSTAENPVDIVNLLNRYFYSVFKHSDTTIDHFFSVAPDNDTTDLTTIADISLTEEEVCVVLKALDEVKATGPDKIPALMLKNCTVNISSSLCQLFNKSLSCGILPSEWKLANISPIPKRNPIHDVTNYRPISLLSLVSKVFERCIYNRLIEHVYSQIYELQYGFLRGRSTTSQLLHILHQVLNVLQQKKPS